MENIGLRNHSRNFEKSLPQGKAYINLCPKETNVILNVPLVEELNLSYCFNYLAKDTMGTMGYGGHISLFKKVDCNRVTNADFSVDTYSFGVEDKETGTKLTTDDGNQQYEITDKQDNIIKYMNGIYDFPSKITFSSGKVVDINFDSSNIYLESGDYRAVITRSDSGRVSEICVYCRDQLMKTLSMTYRNGLLFGFDIMSERAGGALSTIDIFHTDNSIEYIDETTNNGAKFIFANSKICEIEGICAGRRNKEFYFTFDEQNNIAVVSDFFGSSERYFFEKRVIENKDYYFCSLCVSSNGTVSCEAIDDSFKVAYDFSYDKALVNGAVLKNASLDYFGANCCSYPQVEVEESYLQSTAKTCSNFNVSKSISVHGNGSDTFVLSCLVKSIDSTPCTITGRLNNEYKTIDVFNNWKMLCVTLNSGHSFDELIVGLHATGNVAIATINVFKNSYAEFYKYDGNGNSVSSGDSSLSYQGNMVSSIIDGSGARYYVEYNDDKELTKFRAPNGVTVDCEYQGHKLTLQKINSQSHRIEYSYDYDGDRLVFEGGDRPEMRYEYDDFGSIRRVYDAFWSVVDSEYNEYGDLAKLIGRLNDYDERGYVDVEYSYYSNRKLKRITISNGTFYEFGYDNLLRLEKVSLNGECFFKVTYDDNNQIKRQYFGESSDYFEFDYNENKALRSVSYPSTSLSYNYSYDEYNRLIEIKEIRGQEEKIIEAYEYDNQGQISRVTNETKEISKLLDNNGDNARTQSIFNGKKIIQEFDSVNRSRGSNPETILDELKTQNTFNVAPLIDNFDCVGDRTSYSCFSRTTQSPMGGSPQLDGTIPYINTSKYPCYIPYDDTMPHTCETVAFWFKSGHKTNACLFFAGNDRRYGDKSSLAIYEKKDHFEVLVTTLDGTETCLISTDKNTHYSANKWTFIALTYYSRDDGYGYGFDGECLLRVNNKLYRRTLNGYSEYCDLTSKELEMDFGFKVDYSNSENPSIEDPFTNCKLALIAIGKRRPLPDSEIYKYYRKTRDYFIDNEVLEDAGFYAADCSITNIIKTPDKDFGIFKVFPLDNNVFSLDYSASTQNEENEPFQFDIREGSESDKDRTFNFNKALKRYAFVADGNRLSYKANLGQSWTIAGNFYFNEANDKQYLFDVKSKKTKLCLFRDRDGKLVVKFNGTDHTTRFTPLLNVWHNVSISSDIRIQSDSGLATTKRYFRLYFDGGEELFSFTCRTDMDVAEIMLGRSFEEETTGSYWDRTTTCHALFGQIANFTHCKAYCTKETIDNLFDKFKNFSKIKYYDELGFLREEKIILEGQSIFTKHMRHAGPSRVDSEVFETCGQSIRKEYNYDQVGNLTHVYFAYPERYHIYYEYNARGFLTKEILEDSTRTYEYDANGNIKKRKIDPVLGFNSNTTIVGKTDTFEYDRNSPDKLIRFNNTNIEYDLKAPGNISSIGDWKYEYEGRRLKKAINEKRLVDPFFGRVITKIVVEFDYDDKGLRTSKHFSFSSGSDESHLITRRQYVIKYEYDDGNLVYEKSDDKEIFYLYDENNVAYGYIINGEKYFYLRDAYNNIFGLIDEQGVIVARYNYDAYGNCISETGNIYNPIRYKGYYYDSEIEMFYCKSRYYVPNLCRWLNADNATFIQEDKINRLNLYSYCMNNPILYCDPEGHFCFVGLLIAIGIGALVSAIVYTASEVVSYLRTGKWTWSWAKFVGKTIGGAVGGALYYICPGASAQLVEAISSFIETGASMLLQNLWEGTNYSPDEILFGSLIDAGIGALTSFIGGKIKFKIPHVNKCRGSCLAVSKQIMTKFRKGMIKRITAKTFKKMLAAEMSENLVQYIAEYIIDSFGVQEKLLELYNYLKTL